MNNSCAPVVFVYPASPARQRAFTLVELVTVMIIIGILAAVAIPRFADRGTYDTAGFANQLTAALEHARKSAVAMRRNVCIELGAGSTLTFTRNRNVAPGSFSCDGTELPLAGATRNTLVAPVGVTLAIGSGTGIAFNGLGQPSSSAGATFTVTGSDATTYSVRVEGDSGYVH